MGDTPSLKLVVLGSSPKTHSESQPAACDIVQGRQSYHGPFGHQKIRWRGFHL